MTDDFSRFLGDAASDAMHEEYAQGIADTVRAEGLDSADQVEISTEDIDPAFAIDVERIRRRANEILGH